MKEQDLETKKYQCQYCGRYECEINPNTDKPYHLCYDCNVLLKNKIIAYCETGKHYYNIECGENNIQHDIRKKWNTPYRCLDGHYVRSKAEVIIDDCLYNHNIVHCYEKAIFIPNHPNKMLICDFYIPNRDLYVEYWGMDNEDYSARRDEKMELYSSMGKRVLSLEDNDIKNIEDVIFRELNADRRSK